MHTCRLYAKIQHPSFASVRNYEEIGDLTGREFKIVVFQTVERLSKDLCEEKFTSHLEFFASPLTEKILQYSKNIEMEYQACCYVRNFIYFVNAFL